MTATPEPARLCIGLISGTSADGIDAALVEIAGHAADATPTLRAFMSLPYPEAVRAELFALFEQVSPAVARLCSLNFVLGELFADAAFAVCQQAGVEMEAVHVIGSHGQTLWHQPDHDLAQPGSIRSTIQIAEPAVIAERTRRTVVADFRVADIAAGGQGAPLVPYFDWVVLRHPTRHRAVQNIGGIGNVTDLRANADVASVRAFDTGPGNMLIDGLVTLLTGGDATFDRDGAFAAAGNVSQGLLDQLLRDDYLEQAPPKTTGRERYGLPFCRQLLQESGLREGALSSPEDRQQALDLIATITAFTARTIADAYARWLPGIDEALIGGGGSRNPTLLRFIQDAIAPVPIRTVDEVGVNSDAKEAMAFALMAHDTLAGYPTNVPGATGAHRAVSLGKVVRSGVEEARGRAVEKNDR